MLKFSLCSAFGLFSAPYVFHKGFDQAFRKVLENTGSLYNHVLWTMIGRSAIVQDIRESCRIKAQAVSGDLYNAGFVINKEKSVWEPTQLLHWLGITWNSALGTLKIVEKRIVKITNTIDHIIEADLKLSARVLASFTDQIISTGPVVGNFGRIMTRHCALSTLCKDNWDSVLRLDDYCKEELYFWNDNMVNINTRYIVL